MPQNVVFRYVKGQVSPHANFLYKLALLGVDLNWLLTGQPSKVPEHLQKFAPIIGNMTESQLEMLQQIADTVSKFQVGKKKARDLHK